MLTMYRDRGAIDRSDAPPDLPDDVIWMDLLDPSENERALVERLSGVHLPSREDLSEIEASSRLVVDRGVLYLSTPMVAQGSTADASISPSGFVLSPRLLVTIRYAEFPTFNTVAEQMRRDESLASSVGVFTALLEAIVDRGADVLEHLRAELDRVSRSIFHGDPSLRQHTVRSTDALRRTLSKVGAIGERASQARDVLLGVGRIAPFASDIGREWIPPELEVRLLAVCKDVASLSDYETHLSDKVQFLLDAVLGYITIQQNDVFKILTIASVVGVPPTLLAGIWGMNFKNMPELSWAWGYPLALGAMVLSGVAPLLWFKARGWF